MTRTKANSIVQQLDEFSAELIESGHSVATSEIAHTLSQSFNCQEILTEALRNVVETGEKSGESNLSLHAIANLVKQKYCSKLNTNI